MKEIPVLLYHNIGDYPEKMMEDGISIDSFKRQMKYLSDNGFKVVSLEQALEHLNKKIKLSPGRYWVALGFTGSPIINWFYSYGKPVGPQDGTRYKTIFDRTWSRSLSFEFNYRIVGFSAIYK